MVEMASARVGRTVGATATASEEHRSLDKPCKEHKPRKEGETRRCISRTHFDLLHNHCPMPSADAGCGVLAAKGPMLTKYPNFYTHAPMGAA